ncbi:MAG: 50S ribosomal protein L10 [Candidatus Magasanikbacteria bacterium RIFOXYD2_FULL_39_9]|uniref:Large ribosomal subunit protein uL10 n=1 Tax=Candidatus Magasanikbacteria bacterium RIFOXYD1_FULL_40_23 TaxID=1798705 RepID=A0A1F6P7H2_9BACT|nr:MAG: 50S ribosomal protein L10 [Candidatus Magasanikbacteria bacterium RIFOXYD1_FULL_40_23]OGH92190.1 MAG: 50S ribosomal protein L10 [Candidatus Magasanikbacteria bacterium RIFOXYD2_FULL_39_9]
MPKSKLQKQETIKSLEDGLKSAKAVVFANFQGLKVSEAEELRRECRKNDIKVVAAKKTLVKRACQEMGLTDVDPKVFSGGVATFMALGDEVSAARIVNNFSKTHEILQVFGGVLEGKFISVAMVKSLANLPSKQELLAKLVGSINAPVSGFVNVLAGNLRGLVGVLNNIAKSKV